MICRQDNGHTIEHAPRPMKRQSECTAEERAHRRLGEKRREEKRRIQVYMRKKRRNGDRLDKAGKKCTRKRGGEDKNGEKRYHAVVVFIIRAAAIRRSETTKREKKKKTTTTSPRRIAAVDLVALPRPISVRRWSLRGVSLSAWLFYSCYYYYYHYYYYYCYHFTARFSCLCSSSWRNSGAISEQRLLFVETIPGGA